ncbi:MAG TPA: YciI family protein [Vicinamibacterales bacterium]|nr:YciI family protein [Vicinamibacterales bacterium]
MPAKTTYALLIYRGDREPTPEDDRRALKAHRAVQSESSAQGELHAVARLDHAGTAKTVRVRRGAHATSDGPYAETKEWLVGFYLVDCANEEEALRRAREICPIDDHAIEVRPVTWRWTP